MEQTPRRKVLLYGIGLLVGSSGCLNSTGIFGSTISKALILKNFDGEGHELTITINRQKEEVFSHTFNLPPNHEDGSTKRIEDVATQKGTFNVVASLDGDQEEDFTWDVIGGSSDLFARITKNGSLELREAPEM